MAGKGFRKVEHAMLFALLLLSFFRTYNSYPDSRYPYHHDEWQHIAITLQDMDEGYNNQFNPYLGVQKYHADMEPGFHLFLAVLFGVPGLDPIFHYRLLAGLCSVFTAFVIFLCVYRLSGRPFAGLASVAAFIALPSNVNMLGKDFFVPLTLSIPFIYLYALFFSEGVFDHGMKKLMLSAILFASMVLIYPLAPVLLIIPSSIILISKSTQLSDIYRKMPAGPKLAFFVSFAVMAAVVFRMVWKKTFFHTRKYILEVIHFGRGWGRHDVIYSIPLLYSAYSSFFAVIGFMKTAFGDDEKKLVFFNYAALLSLTLTAIFVTFEFTIMVPYIRAVYFSMLFLIPLTGIGLAYSVDYAIRTFSLENGKAIVHILALALFAAAAMSSVYNLNDQYREYAEPVINSDDYRALIWAKENLAGGSRLVTPYLMTSAVYPISGHMVISLVPAQMEGGLIDENLGFFNFGCDRQNEILAAGNATHIISRVRLSCPNLKELHYSGDYIYKVS